MTDLTSHAPATAAIILAGGTSTRMGGEDKTRARIAGRTSLERVLGAAPAERRIVVGHQGDDAEALRRDHGAEFVQEHPPRSGPLAALARGLHELHEAADAEVVLVLGGDMPLLRTPTLQRLIDGARADGAVHALIDAAGKTQYLCAAWPLGRMRANLEAVTSACGGSVDGVGLHRLYRALAETAPDALVTEPAQAQEAADIDTPEDLDAARAATGLRIVLAQIVVPEDPSALTGLLAQAAQDAADAGAHLLVLPEATLTPFGTELLRAAEERGDAFATQLETLGARHGLVIIAGSFTTTPDGRVHNTLLVRGALPGEPPVCAEYHKIHLYDAWGARESETVAPGSELVTVDLRGLRIGLSTCYDVRFPEQFRALARRGAHAVVLPLAWGDGPGKEEQLRLLLRARALDATVHLLACDQAPPEDWEGSAPRGVGRSAAIGPLGQVRDELGREPGMIVIDIDVDSVQAARTALPVLEHEVPLR